MVAAGNAWGLFLVILLMGYGLVTVPRVLWRRGDLEGTLKYFEFKASILHTSLSDTKHELVELAKQINSAWQSLDDEDELKQHAEDMLKRCPPETINATKSLFKAIFGSKVDINLDKLAEMNRKLKALLAEYNRTEW